MKILWDLLGDRCKASSRVRAYWVEEELVAGGVESEHGCGDTKVDLLRLAAAVRQVPCDLNKVERCRHDITL